MSPRFLKIAGAVAVAAWLSLGAPALPTAPAEIFGVAAERRCGAKNGKPVAEH